MEKAASVLKSLLSLQDNNQAIEGVINGACYERNYSEHLFALITYFASDPYSLSAFFSPYLNTSEIKAIPKVLVKIKEFLSFMSDDDMLQSLVTKNLISDNLIFSLLFFNKSALLCQFSSTTNDVLNPIYESLFFTNPSGYSNMQLESLSLYLMRRVQAFLSNDLPELVCELANLSCLNELSKQYSNPASIVHLAAYSLSFADFLPFVVFNSAKFAVILKKIHFPNSKFMLTLNYCAFTESINSINDPESKLVLQNRLNSLTLLAFNSVLPTDILSNDQCYLFMTSFKNLLDGKKTSLLKILKEHKIQLVPIIFDNLEFLKVGTNLKTSISIKDNFHSYTGYTDLIEICNEVTKKDLVEFISK